MLKSYGVGGGGWVAWSNLVSAQGPLVLGLGLRVWGQGLTIIPLVVRIKHLNAPSQCSNTALNI